MKRLRQTAASPPAQRRRYTVSRTSAMPDRLAFRLPNPQVAHGLQTDRIKGRGEGRHVMRQQIDLDHHSRRQDQHAHNQKPDAAIQKDAPHHEQRKQQREAGIKQNVERDLEQASAAKSP